MTERRMSALSEVRTVFVEEVARGSGRLSYRIIGLAVPVILIALLLVTPLAQGIFLDDEDDTGVPSDYRIGRGGSLRRAHRRLCKQPRDSGLPRPPDWPGCPGRQRDYEAIFVLPEDYISDGRGPVAAQGICGYI